MQPTLVGVIQFILRCWKNTCSTSFLVTDVIQTWFKPLLPRPLLDLPSSIHHPKQSKVANNLNKCYTSIFLLTISECRFEGFRSSRTPSLLKKSSLTPTSGTSSLSADRSSHHDSWRTMVLLHAISELWLSHVNTGSGESSDLQHPGSPSRQISILQVLSISFTNLFLNCCL